MRLRAVFDAAQVQAAMGQGAMLIPAAREAMLRSLAIQAERSATRLAGGPGTDAPGAYPIPIRTGTLRRGMRFRVQKDSAIVFNSVAYARAVHDGYQPYGNPRAHAIPARPYFSDAIAELDLDAAADAWARQMGAQ